MHYPKRLIEVDLPIKRISEHARKEKSKHSGHISSMHIWWARRPLASCRAVLCATLWLDPNDPLCPKSYILEAKREMVNWGLSQNLGLLSKESFERFKKVNKDSGLVDNLLFLRELLLDFISDFASWENGQKKEFLSTAKILTRASHKALTSDEEEAPTVVDPFAGGGAIPLEALRLGANSFASDINPVPILLNKVILEYAPKYGPKLIEQIRLSSKEIRNHQQLAIQKFYGSSSKEEKRQSFFWARTIKCEGPNCGYVFPLFRSLWLCNKPKKRIGLKLAPNPKKKQVDIEIIHQVSIRDVKEGTSKLGSATCPVCKFTTPVEHVRSQLSSRHGGANDAKLYAVCFTNNSPGKSYRPPTKDELLAFEGSLNKYHELRAEKLNNETTIPSEELNHLRGFF